MNINHSVNRLNICKQQNKELKKYLPNKNAQTSETQAGQNSRRIDTSP